MRRFAPLFLLLLAACPTYERYGYVTSEHGVLPGDEYARYGHDQAMAVAIGREFGHAFAGFKAADYAKQAGEAMTYAKTFPDVKSISADTLGHRLVVTFASGWSTQITPIDDGKRGDETMKTYDEEKSAEVAMAETGPDSTAIAAMTMDVKNVEPGKKVFEQYCTTCHGPDGGGNIGPNLTDDFWLHGGTFPAIAMTVARGVPDKGMPTWGNTLSMDDIKAAASYVWSLHGTTPKNPKAPQGTRVAR